VSEDFEHEGYIRISVPADLSLDEGWELEALLRTVEEAMAEAKARPDGSTYQMVVELPADIERVLLDEVFEFIADAAHEFEERWPNRTWDVHVAGGVLSESHSAEAAFRRVFAENERLREQHEDSIKINEDWVEYKGRVKAREVAWREALTAALGLEESAPLSSMEELIGRAAALQAVLKGLLEEEVS
jgi:hypothetical protein